MATLYATFAETHDLEVVAGQLGNARGGAGGRGDKVLDLARLGATVHPVLRPSGRTEAVVGALAFRRSPRNQSSLPMPAMKPRKAEKSRAPATTGDASSAPATASEGALPTVSGTGPGEWNDALVAGVVQVCGRLRSGNGAATTGDGIGPGSGLELGL